MSTHQTTALPASHKASGHLWRKGQSGNPAGKRKGSVSLAAAVKRLLLAEPHLVDQVARTLVDGAIAGDVSMARLLFERVDGHKSNPFFSVTVDASDRRAVSISPQTLSEIAESRRKYEEKLICPQSPTT
jgi:hypothetical protein